MSTLKTNKIENLTTADGGISINNSGNVGINVSGPDCLFHVKETGGDSVPARVTSSGTLSTIGFETSASANSYNVRCGATGANDFVAYTNNSEKLRITSDGKIGIGTSAPDYNFQLAKDSAILAINATNQSSSSLSTLMFRNKDGAGNTGNVASIAGRTTADGGNGELVFKTASSGSQGERLRIASDGRATFTANVTIDGSITLAADNPDWTINPSGISNLYGRIDLGTDSNAIAGTALYVVSNDNNTWAAAANFKNKGTGPSFICMTSAGSDAFRVENNGDVKSATNSYGAVSDVKMKENIVDASSQWDDVKAIRVRKFNFKEDTLYDTSTQIGVVAQEIETVSPGLVTSTVDSDEEGKDLGTVTKSVKYSVLYMKSVKALQEAMARIETLEAEVAALKSN